MSPHHMHRKLVDRYRPHVIALTKKKHPRAKVWSPDLQSMQSKSYDAIMQAPDTSRQEYSILAVKRSRFLGRRLPSTAKYLRGSSSVFLASWSGQQCRIGHVDSYTGKLPRGI